MSPSSALCSFLIEHGYLFAGVLLAGFAVAWFFPLLGDGALRPLERALSNFAQRKTLAILAVGIGAILIRLCFLPILPVPVPEVHDEFSHLLAADTFAHGRITNPPHAMAVYFETFHVLQAPTYMSKYPPAESAVFLAVGEKLGNPWIGVLLGLGLMCGALLWMLQGWFAPKWAFLGAALAFFQIGLWTYWVNTYLGGPSAAIGGALLMGALPRIFRRVSRSQRIRDAVILAIGVAILANSRPYEGLLLCIPVVVALCLFFWRRRAEWPTLFVRLVVPAACVLAAVAIFMGYYNWRVTDSALTMPYVLYERTHSSTPLFIWQKLRPPIQYANPQFARLEEVFNLGAYKERWRNLLHLTSQRAVFEFFFLPALWIPFLVAWRRAVGDKRLRLLFWQFAFCVVGTFAPIWLAPHYAAPLTATIFALVGQGMRHMRLGTYRARPVGGGLSRLVVLLTIGISIPNAIDIRRTNGSTFTEPQFGLQRASVERQLEELPGKQLVIVRYLPDGGHNIHQDGVSNQADIDDAKVVWAREIPGVDTMPLLNYFRERRSWRWETA